MLSRAQEAAQRRVRELRRFKALGLVPLGGEFFTTVAYPPLKSYGPVSEEDFFQGYVPPKDALFSLYVHIPFCARQCTFCHVPTTSQPDAGVVERYLAALERELELCLRRLGLPQLKARAILLGGGTPTQLSPAQLKRLLGRLTSRLDLSQLTQFSVDAEPSTLLGAAGRERLELLRAHGADRLCLGIDSFDEDLLKAMNRGYTAVQAAEAAGLAKDLGFSLNIEFIYGYPGQSVVSWDASMETAIGLAPDEIQLYRLKVIPYKGFEGAIFKQFAAQRERFPSDEEVARLKAHAHCRLQEHGYLENRYRVFARDPESYSHYADSLAFKLEDLLAFGATARTSLRDRYGVNCLDLPGYHDSIAQGRLPLGAGRVRTAEEQLRWAFLLPLRIKELRKERFATLTGRQAAGLFPRKIERLKAHGLLEEDESALRLTELGRFFAGEVSYQFYHPAQMPFPRSAFAEAELNPYDDPEP